MTEINKLPFFFQSHSDPFNGGFPQNFPFHLYYDNDLKMFRQRATPELKEMLNRVYKQGSLVEGSVSSGSGKVYIDKIISYIFEHFNINEHSDVLEVGFGSGILLKELKQKGVKNLNGIEPGNHKLVKGLEGINLIHDFFPSALLAEKFDLIYTLLVLEHIEEPVEYLKDLISSLKDNGKIIFGVPNCEPYLQEGDLSIFIHEHYSYFTIESIIAIVGKAGFGIEDISIIEGAYIVTVSAGAVDYPDASVVFSEKDFNDKISVHLKKVDQLFKRYKQTGIAVYAPTRAINSLFFLEKAAVRLVDDNSELQGRYLPALTNKVESYEQFVSNPTECLLIFSRTFGERIKQKCKSDKRLDNTTIVTLNDLDNSEEII